MTWILTPDDLDSNSLASSLLLVFGGGGGGGEALERWKTERERERGKKKETVRREGLLRHQRATVIMKIFISKIIKLADRKQT